MRFIFVAVMMALMLFSCKAPGVGELEERIDELESSTAYDDSDLVDRVDYVEEEIVMLDERVTAIEMGEFVEIPEVPQQVQEPVQEPTQIEEPEQIPQELPPPTMDDIPGLLDSLSYMEMSVYDSITVVGMSVDQLSLRLDSVSAENDSLRAELDELKETVQDLSWAVDNLRSTSSSGSSGTGGRGSTSGGSSGGSTGDRTTTSGSSGTSSGTSTGGR
jgi:hypothetical protein